MTSRTSIALAIVPLLFIGAGCFSAADKTASDALLPVTTSMDALQQAKELTAEDRARALYEAEKTTNEVGVAMILLSGEDPKPGMEVGGTIGCDDRTAIAHLSRESVTGNTVHDALATLFTVRDTTVGTLHNSLADSRLAVDNIRSTDGVTTEVWINGTISSAGACDDPRIRAQVEETIRRFKPQFKVILNGSEAEWRCFGDMSGACIPTP